jgi:hypothetical protein
MKMKNVMQMDCRERRLELFITCTPYVALYEIENGFHFHYFTFSCSALPVTYITSLSEGPPATLVQLVSPAEYKKCWVPKVRAALFGDNPGSSAVQICSNVAPCFRLDLDLTLKIAPFCSLSRQNSHKFLPTY